MSLIKKFLEITHTDKKNSLDSGEKILNREYYFLNNHFLESRKISSFNIVLLSKDVFSRIKLICLSV